MEFGWEGDYWRWPGASGCEFGKVRKPGVCCGRGGGREFKRSVATVEGVEDSLANILAILSSKKFTVVGFVLPHF